MNGIKASAGMEVEGGKAYRVKTLNASLAAAMRRYRRNIRTHGRRNAKWTREFIVAWLKQWKGRGLSLQGEGLDAYIVTNNPNYEKLYQGKFEIDETEAKYQADLVKMKTRLAEGKITQTQFNNWKALQRDLRQKGSNEAARQARDEALYPWNKAGADAGKVQNSSVPTEPAVPVPAVSVPPAAVLEQPLPALAEPMGELDALDEARSREMEVLSREPAQPQVLSKAAPALAAIETPVRRRIRGVARLFDILPLSMQKKSSAPGTKKPAPAQGGRRDVPLSLEGPFIRRHVSDTMLVRDPVLLRDDRQGNVISAIVGVFVPESDEDTDSHSQKGPGPMPPVLPGPAVPVVYPFSGLIPKGGSPDPHPDPHGKMPSGGANPPHPPAAR